MKDYKWYRTKNGIRFTLEPGIVRLKNDAALAWAMKNGGHRHDGTGVSDMMIYAHRKKMNRDLRITSASLDSEIFWHIKAMELCVFCRGTFLYRISRLFRGKVEWLYVHMDVIDCGEKDVDNNRFVWDIASKLGL